jgi:ATP-dependent protease HslVU (ClpYQ) ATPase subunit
MRPQMKTRQIARDIFRKKLQSGYSSKTAKSNCKHCRNQAGPPGIAVQMMAIPGMEEIENQMQNMLGDIFPEEAREPAQDHHRAGTQGCCIRKNSNS